VDDGRLLWTVGVVALLDGVATIAQTAHQARLASGVYVAVSLGQFLVKVALCVLFVAGLGWGIWGVVAASAIRSVCFVTLLLALEARHGIAWPDRTTLRAMLGFALPFVPAGLCFFVLNSGDRFFLVRFAGTEEVGIYGLGYRLAMLVGLFSLTPLFRVWSARMHDAARGPDGPAVFARMTTYLLGAYILVGLGLCLFAEEAIVLFAGPAFVSAALIVPPVVLANGFQGASLLFDGAFYVRRQTRWKLPVAVASTIVMLALYALWIPGWGTLGAALATLAGYAFHAGLTCLVARRVFPVRYEWGRLAAMLSLAGALWLAGQALGHGWELLPCRLALWLLWPALLWMVGLIDVEEKAVVLDAFRTATARLRAFDPRRLATTPAPWQRTR
jgi:O-antigen/teichoic acid export membrane protein